MHWEQWGCSTQAHTSARTRTRHVWLCKHAQARTCSRAHRSVALMLGLRPAATAGPVCTCGKPRPAAPVPPAPFWAASSSGSASCAYVWAKQWRGSRAFSSGVLWLLYTRAKHSPAVGTAGWLQTYVCVSTRVC